MPKFIGDSSYAIQSPNFPVARWLRIMTRIKKGNPICTCLWKTFGEDNSGIQEFMHHFEGRQKAIEIFMGNGAGREKDNSGEGHFLPGVSKGEYSKRLRNKHPKTLNLIDERNREITDFCHLIDDGLTEFLMCWELEDHLEDEAYRILDKHGRRIWPWKTVRCRSDRVGANFEEKHGSQVSGGSQTICNQDGDESFTKEEAKKFLERNAGKAKATILWDRRAQGKGLPRRKRKFIITDGDINQRGGLLARY